MFSQRFVPTHLAPETLDIHLEKGWYRYGQSLGTCRFLMREGQLVTVVWTRLPIKGFSFRKGQRKLFRKIKQRFKVVVQAERQNVPEKEALYQLYKADFNGSLAPTLNASLYDNKPHNVFDSYEVCIYDNDKLIAFSVFDKGASAVESIKGVYHPDYKAYSLGYFTMLAEIQFCIDQQIDYYYPGYVTPGLSAFNYKLRIGDVEYYDYHRQQWFPWATFDEGTLDGKVMLDKLTELQQALAKKNISSRLLLNPLYEIELWSLQAHFHLGYPLVLEAYPHRYRNEALNFVYNIDQRQYHFIPCFPLQDISIHFPSSEQENAIPYVDTLMGMLTNRRAGDTPAEAMRRLSAWLSQRIYEDIK